MSTTLYEHDGLYLTRFYGGDARGVCYQISTDKCEHAASRFVQLTQAEMMQITNVFLREVTKNA